MKKNISRRLGFILLLAILFSLILNCLVQFHGIIFDRLADTQQLFWEMRQILAASQEESKLVEDDFKQISLVRAKAAAYIVQHTPDVLEDSRELKKIARLLQVDELHIFDQKGIIFTGSEPQYYGMSFRSGAQMAYFLPMINNKALSLCQEITPNTAEGNLMQYAAVWCEDGSNIVQVGLKPERVLTAQKKTDLSYVFSLVTVDPNSDIYAIDSKTLEIQASTHNRANEKNAMALGFDPTVLGTSDHVFFQTIQGVHSICIFEKADNLILASVQRSSIVFQSLFKNTLLLALYIIAISGIAVFFIMRYLDKNIIRAIHSINERMVMIGRGNLHVELPPQTTPEMTELSSHIQDMVTNLMNQQTQLSLILDTVKLPLGTYEYNTKTKLLTINPRAAEILELSADSSTGEYNPVFFCKIMDKVLASPEKNTPNVYLLPGNPPRYVHVEYFRSDVSVLGIIIDVTKDFQERQTMAHERDVDLLTGLLSRRAFYRTMEELMRDREHLQISAFVMIDADNLKFVNDTYGHNSGDVYLQSIARLLENLPADKITSRLSGDEFIIFIHGYESREEIEKIISMLCQQRDNTWLTLDGERIPVQFSVGCAFYPQEGDNYSFLMKLADQRMYAEKKLRKGIQ